MEPDSNERDRFWRLVNESVDRLKADPDAWNDYLQEIELLNGGSMDGLQGDPYFTPEEEGKVRAESRAADK